ncbi:MULTISPECIES: hypothetical protein [unclassified Methanosarcina]|uniref:hypothetical protein n=1 Tax=unclassified Methanosarcina TaxID=2644672 RepID=UPI000615A4BA|nr:MULTISPECIES: hypothetical protein [unclassified Methanosarcina]AKB22776.1 hypothetical protein MSWH1_2505 [Methanosarcina sp. WH1]
MTRSVYGFFAAETNLNRIVEKDSSGWILALRRASYTSSDTQNTRVEPVDCGNGISFLETQNRNSKLSFCRTGYFR